MSDSPLTDAMIIDLIVRARKGYGLRMDVLDPVEDYRGILSATAQYVQEVDQILVHRAPKGWKRIFTS